MNLPKHIEEKFDEKFKCIQGDCDGHGYIPRQVDEGEWEADQCQFHAEYLFPLKSFIAQILEEEKERLVGEIEKVRDIEPESNGRYNACNEILAIIKK